jgi:site-specific DNA-methyltransferase (adenine-specific)/modification methylase
MKIYYENNLGVLYHGDCREIMGSLRYDAILTDPQYRLANNKRATLSRGINKSSIFGSGKIYDKNWLLIQGDEDFFDPSHLVSDRPTIIWGGIHFANKLPNSASWIVWDKRCHRKPDDNADCEMAWSNLGGPARIYRQLWRGAIREGEENVSNGPKLHPFQKPIQLMLWCLCMPKMSEACTVLDPYVGSGTTAVACEKLNRKWVAIEIEEKFCEIAAKRIEAENRQLKLF